MPSIHQVVVCAVMVITIVGVLFACAGVLAAMGAPALVFAKPIADIMLAAGMLFTLSGISLGFN